KTTDRDPGTKVSRPFGDRVASGGSDGCHSDRNDYAAMPRRKQRATPAGEFRSGSGVEACQTVNRRQVIGVETMPQPQGKDGDAKREPGHRHRRHGVPFPQCLPKTLIADSASGLPVGAYEDRSKFSKFFIRMSF